MTPAQRHRARYLARAGAATLAAIDRPRTGAAATEYELQRARLGVDLRRLKEIQSVEAKIALKRELLPNYADWCQGVLEANAGGQDDILSHMMVWRIDVGDFEGALPLIDYVLRHGLALPERFERTAATMIAEEIADVAIQRLGQGEEFDLGLLEQVEALTAEHDMPDQVRAKLMKAIGLELGRVAVAMEVGGDGPAGGKRAAIEAALARLRRALALNPSSGPKGVGVKADIKRLEREVKALAPAAE